MHGVGTGFVINEDGIGITNQHVVEGVSEFEAEFPSGKTVSGTVVQVGNGVDLAIVDLNGSGYPYLPLGSATKLRAGNTLIVIGAPLGLQHSVSRGIVSQLWAKDGVRLIQTDAAINPGNSGGPVLNEQGDVVAVATWKYTKAGQVAVEGLGFAIFIDEAIDRLPLVLSELPPPMGSTPSGQDSPLDPPRN